MEPAPSTSKNVRPCTFLACKFALQTCYCMEPPPSVAVLKGLLKKVLDTRVRSTIMTQQLKRLRRKSCLPQDRQLRFSRRHIPFFSYRFTGSTTIVGLFYHIQTTYLSLQNGMCFAVAMQNGLYSNAIINKAYYRCARQAVWFDTG